MESIISYSVIILLIIVSIYVYNIRKSQTRIFTLSEQIYATNSLYVMILKKSGKIDSVIISVKAVKPITIDEIKVELITGKREFNYYDLRNIVNEETEFPFKTTSDSETKFTIPFNDFKSMLSDGVHPFRTFRFIISSDSNTPFKSHELGFNKKWVIYRPDTGSYN